MAVRSMSDLLRWMCGGDAKEKSVFASEKEAYEFVQKLYRDSGGVTPELRRAYEFYMKNSQDGCDPEVRPHGSSRSAA